MRRFNKSLFLSSLARNSLLITAVPHNVRTETETETETETADVPELILELGLVLRTRRRRSTQFPIARSGKTHQSQCIVVAACGNTRKSLSVQTETETETETETGTEIF